MINSIAYEKVVFNHPILFIPNLLFADYGCLVPGYPELLIYQTSPPGGIFSNTPNIQPGVGCEWILDTSLPHNGCVGHGRGGIKGTYYQQCPIDDYIPLFFIFTAGIALFKIRKRDKYTNEDIVNYSGI